MAPAEPKSTEMGPPPLLDRLIQQADGAVCSGSYVRRGKVLSPCLSPDRFYWTVVLTREGRRKCYPIHQLVAPAFLGPRPEGLIVRHGTAGSYVNTPENLSYGTWKQNSEDRKRDGSVPVGERHPNAKISDEQALEVRRRVAAGELQKPLATEFGVSKKSISRCVRRETYAHLP